MKVRYPVVVEARAVVVDEKLVVGVLDFSIGDPSPNVGEYGATHLRTACRKCESVTVNNGIHGRNRACPSHLAERERRPHTKHAHEPTARGVTRLCEASEGPRAPKCGASMQYRLEDAEHHIPHCRVTVSGVSTHGADLPSVTRALHVRLRHKLASAAHSLSATKCCLQAWERAGARRRGRRREQQHSRRAVKIGSWRFVLVKRAGR